ncbi:hypothetical protein BC829DRAFT_221271 [Chytridium lagenaria]|nr:hypothetical protein BC829DRAFT_221271 [Chytridium lagenaria]
MLSWIPFPLSPPLSNGCLRTEEQPDDAETGESKRKRRIGSLGWSSSPQGEMKVIVIGPTVSTNSPQSPRLSIDVGAPSSSQETADSTTPPPSSSRVTADVTTPPNRSKPRLVPRSARAYGDEVENTWREDRAFQEFLKEILTTSETLETLARRAIQLGHPAQRVLLAIRTIRLSNASSSPTLDDLLLILSHPVLPPTLNSPHVLLPLPLPLPPSLQLSPPANAPV